MYGTCIDRIEMALPKKSKEELLEQLHQTIKEKQWDQAIAVLREFPSSPI
ncbi:hypothetical protein JYT92_00425 [bacterium AH-315-L15]|nr:hypothetical protein [bacterium AH-315-L15]